MWPRLKRLNVERYKQPSCEIFRYIMRKGEELTNSTLTLILSVKPFTDIPQQYLTLRRQGEGDQTSLDNSCSSLACESRLPKCKIHRLLPSEVTLLPSKQSINRPLINLLSTKTVPVSTAERNVAISVPQMSCAIVVLLWA